jgi:hypothetical protein
VVTTIDSIVDDLEERQRYALKETIDFVREYNPDLDDEAIQSLIEKHVADEMERIRVALALLLDAEGSRNA